MTCVSTSLFMRDRRVPLSSDVHAGWVTKEGKILEGGRVLFTR